MMFLLAFCAFVEWVETPSLGRGQLLGMAVALAVTAKLSALLFLPAAGRPRWSTLRTD